MIDIVQMRAGVRALAVLGLMLSGGAALAQAVAPTPEQMELLRSLPPEEQQALIDKAQDSVTGTSPLVGVGEKVQQEDRKAADGRDQSRRPIRDRDGDGIEDPPELPKSPAELKPYGYDILRRVDGDFEPEAAIPVPNDYVLGPGDRLEVQLYGNERGNYVLIVGRDGQVRFPKLGPVPVGGMRFEDVRNTISTRIARQFVGTEVSISMGELRSIRVFVLGDVERPGSYLVSALSTISNVLLTAGGITTVGSLRDVQLKRAGSVVTRLDLYDLLLKGDSSKDSRLLAGDVVFVPSVGATVAAFGEVNRPAIYEMKPGATVGELLYLSGGLKPRADPRYARLERVRGSSERITVDLNLAAGGDRQRQLESGDLLIVMAIRPSLQESVELTGAVHRPRSFEHTPGLHLTGIISSLDELQPGADPEYVLVRREPELGRVEYLSADLRAALLSPKGAADLALRPRDRVVVLSSGGVVREPRRQTGRAPAAAGNGQDSPGSERAPQEREQAPLARDPDAGLDDRRRALQPLLAELRAGAQVDSPTKVVSINGVVRAPGDYPLEAGMTVSDLLRAGGRPSDAAYPQNAELTRYTIADGERRQTEVRLVDLAAVLRGDAAADLPLQPFDVLTVKLVPEWAEAEFIELAGEVRFPGRYPIRQGETLRGVIERAGGFTPAAFPEGAVFTRASLRQREKEQLDKLATRLQSDLAVLALRNVQSPEKAASGEQALIVGRSLLMDLQNARPVGRLVIDATSLAAGAGAEIELRDGDALFVPRTQQAVTVLGEVQSPTSHLWRTGLDRDDYIGLSGGLTAKADGERIYVVRADGSVVARPRSMFGGGGDAIRPGDTIVAPLDTERVGALSMWTSITQIIYNLAIAVAAVNSF